MSNVFKFASIFNPTSNIENAAVNMFKSWSRFMVNTGTKYRIIHAKRLYDMLYHYIALNLLVQNNNATADEYMKILNITDEKDLVMFFNRDDYPMLVERWGFGDFITYKVELGATTSTTIFPKNTQVTNKTNIKHPNSTTRDRNTYKTKWGKLIPNGVTVSDIKNVLKTDLEKYAVVAYDNTGNYMPLIYIFDFDVKKVMRQEVKECGKAYLRDAIRAQYRDTDQRGVANNNICVLPYGSSQCNTNVTKAYKKKGIDINI